MHIRSATAADLEAIGQVLATSWRRTYPGILPQAYLDRLSVPDLVMHERQVMFDPALKWFGFVLEDDDDDIVGIITGGKELGQHAVYRGQIYALHLLAAYHGQGWGKQLFLTGAEHLHHVGLLPFRLWVYAANPARQFYVALGGEQIDATTNAIDGIAVPIVAYGWHMLPDSVGD